MANLSDFKPTGVDTNNLGPIRGVPSTNQGQVNTSLLIGSSDVIVGEGSLVASDANFSVSIDGPNAINKSLQFRTGSNPRWELLVDNSPESDPTAPSVATKLADPATLPTGTGEGAVFSPDGTHMAVAHNNTPFITIYERSGNTFTKLADPATLPASTGLGVAFSPDGTHLAVSHVSSPFITIYERSGNTFTKLANPATLPPNTGIDVAFSPDGTHMAIGHAITPFVTIYERSGNTFTKLADPATLPASTGRGVAFSPDGTHMTVAHDVSPFITIYERSGNTFTKLANPATLPPGIGRGVAFSPDGTHMTVAHDVSPFITIYERSGNTFTKLANPATLPASTGRGVAFSPDGTHMAVVHNTSPNITIYERSGNTFTKLADPATLPTGQGWGVSFSPDGTHMAVAHSTSPFLTIYDSPVGVNTGGGSDFSIKRRGDNGIILDDPLKITREIGEINLPRVTSINNGPLAGFRNAIINGNFDFWQRGASFNFGSDGFGYTADRWVSRAGISGAATVSRQSFTPGQTDVPGEPRFYLRHDQTTPRTAIVTVLEQRIESVKTLAGKEITYSFWARNTTGTKDFRISVLQQFGTGGTPSAEVVAGLLSISITNFWQKFSFTVSMPSISGKTLGTNNNHFLQVRIDEPSSFSTFTLDVAQAQVEIGPVASEFELRPFQTELSLCQRYYWKTFGVDVTPAQNAGEAGTIQAAAANNGSFTLGGVLHTMMRATPSVATFNPSAANSDARNITDATDKAVSLSTAVGGKIYLHSTTADANNANDRMAIHVTAAAEL